MQELVVHHRVDGLEIEKHSGKAYKLVHHRVDGLEKNQKIQSLIKKVHHRVDGLEIYLILKV